MRALCPTFGDLRALAVTQRLQEEGFDNYVDYGRIFCLLMDLIMRYSRPC